MHFITNGYRTLFKEQLNRSKATCSFNETFAFSVVHVTVDSFHWSMGRNVSQFWILRNRTLLIYFYFVLKCLAYIHYYFIGFYNIFVTSLLLHSFLFDHGQLHFIVGLMSFFYCKVISYKWLLFYIYFVSLWTCCVMYYARLSLCLHFCLFGLFLCLSGCLLMLQLIKTAQYSINIYVT